VEGGVGTVETLGSMTPEDLEILPGIDAPMIEKILMAVNGYYAQFEQPAEEVAAAEEVMAAEVLAGETLAGPETVPQELESAPEVELAEELAPVVSGVEKGESDRMEDSDHVG